MISIAGGAAARSYHPSQSQGAPSSGGPLPWLAIAQAGENGEPAGWQIAWGPDHQIEIAMVGWRPAATFGALCALVSELPRARTLVLRSTPFRIITDDERAEIAALRRG